MEDARQHVEDVAQQLWGCQGLLDVVEPNTGQDEIERDEYDQERVHGQNSHILT